MRGLGLALAVACAASALACNAILGLQEPTVDDTLGDGGGGGDGGACKDTSSDPLNCGACGHSCQGGTCAAAKCQPQLVTDAPNLIAPYDMVVGDDGFLYFSNGNSDTGVKSVTRIDKTTVNGQPELLVDWTQHEGYPNQIAVAGGNFFFAVDSNVANPYWGGGIVECPTSGCPANQGITRGNLSSYAVATDGTNVFFTDDYTDGNFNDFYELKIGDTNLQGIKSLISDPNGDDVSYLDTDHDGGIYAAYSTGIYACNVAGCNDAGTQVLGTFQLHAEELRVAGDRLYFTSDPFQGAPSVQWVPITGGQPTQVATNVDFPLAIVVDDTYFYFTDVGNTTNPNEGRVVRCPRDGCGVGDADAVILSVGDAAGHNPRALAQDATMLYWGTYQGQVWKVAK